MSSHAGALQLAKLKQLMIANGFRDVDLLQPGAGGFGKGEAVVCLALVGYMFDVMFPSAVLVYLAKYEWFVKEDGDEAFVRMLWRLIRHETGRAPSISVEQFFQPRFADAKVSLLLDIFNVLKRAAAAAGQPCSPQRPPAARSQRPPPPQPAPSPQQQQQRPVPHVARPLNPTRATVFNPIRSEGRRT
eukprot:TRINITY_DN32551_c0_g1_i1.p3 TRINITY_DN32551_c0_g1~~TRINITY_DN32551_c0_g1_i1.p3  ORF type:complete len:188 (+),score=67.88 TRINITY_DN32551_c0_g1_i1:51-614(+)